MHKEYTIKNSTGRSIRRLTAAFGLTLLVALAVSSPAGLFRGPMPDAAGSRGNDTSVSGSSAPDEATRARITEAFGKLPLRFEANQGQSDERVKFLSRGSGYTLFLTSTEAVLSLSRPEGTGDRSTATDGGEQKNKSKRARRDVLRMRLLGASSTPRVEGADELSVRSNYFIGNDPQKWRTDVRQYAKVRYARVYPGIDLVYYGNQQELEYDFIVAPGASPSEIRLAFKGAEEVSIGEEGDLILRTGGGEVRQRKPFIYQEVAGGRREVEGRYAKTGEHEAGFRVGEYDATKPLVIDPVLSYSTYLGADGHDFGRGIAVDSAGNAYVTGHTESTSFPTRNQYQTDQSLTDAFVTKLNTNLSGDASLVYSTYLGGSGGDEGFGIDVDGAGNAYVTGETYSTDFPVLNQYQTYQPQPLTVRDAFVVKLAEPAQSTPTPTPEPTPTPTPEPTPTPTPATLTVNSIADTTGPCTPEAGGCTLREAIAAANADAGAETITFDIPGAGPHTIQLTQALPALSESVNITNTSGESTTVRARGMRTPTASSPSTPARRSTSRT